MESLSANLDTDTWRRYGIHIPLPQSQAALRLGRTRAEMRSCGVALRVRLSSSRTETAGTQFFDDPLHFDLVL